LNTCNDDSSIRQINLLNEAHAVESITGFVCEELRLVCDQPNWVRQGVAVKTNSSGKLALTVSFRKKAHSGSIALLRMTGCWR
jgi:hypothetical protein